MTFLGVKATAKSVHPHMCGEHVEDYGNAASKPVHPHMCGEHEFDEVLPVRQVGSSPHVWGAFNSVHRQATVRRFIPTCVGSIDPFVYPPWPTRFIPTCVGSIQAPRPRPRLYSVHPHMCGEHAAVISYVIASPVHPHMCGEHQITEKDGKLNGGSSPHVWGASV